MQHIEIFKSKWDDWNMQLIFFLLGEVWGFFLIALFAKGRSKHPPQCSFSEVNDSWLSYIWGFFFLPLFWLSSCLPLAPLFVAYCFGTLQHKTLNPCHCKRCQKRMWLVCLKKWEVKNKLKVFTFHFNCKHIG